tara:strand:- start:2157 stop:2549 length:393 start_codon:yes stop_codon:yes gene_type:complete
MDYTIIFLKYLGFFYLLYGLSSLLNKKISNTLMTLVKDDGQLFFLGFMTILFSMPIVLLHNIWDSYLAGFVSFFGWATLLKGFFIWSFPDYIKSKAESRLNERNLKMRSVFSLVLALVLLYFACNPSCLI